MKKTTGSSLMLLTTRTNGFQVSSTGPIGISRGTYGISFKILDPMGMMSKLLLTRVKEQTKLFKNS